ncbi:MAG: hypothetical protein ACREOY_14295 [Candidatus Dormibacteraceae bacterium]
MRRAGPVLAVVVLTLAVHVQAALAEPTDPGSGSVQVGPTSNGPVVSQGSAGYDPNGISATASSKPSGSQTTSSGPNYTYRPVPYGAVPASCWTQNNATLSNPCAAFSQAVCPAGEIGYYVYDSNGNSLGVVCVPNPTDSLLPPTTPEIALADQASSRQPWPALVLGINPSIGLTGLPSWFWLGGATASMPDAVASSGPLTVRVRARLVGVTWEFGDGIGYDSIDLGQAYPAQSDVQHIYQTDTYGHQAGYTVAGILRYLVTYSVNGGPWTTLGVKVKAFAQHYFVYQVQPEAVAAS